MTITITLLVFLGGGIAGVPQPPSTRRAPQNKAHSFSPVGWGWGLTRTTIHSSNNILKIYFVPGSELKPSKRMK